MYFFSIFYIQSSVNHMGTISVFYFVFSLMYQLPIVSRLRQKLISDHPGSLGGSVVLLDWTVHWPWRV